jgi:hypothetical protein
MEKFKPTTVEIKISAKKTDILTKKSNSVKSNRVMNENIAYCIEHYVSAGQLVCMSLTKNGNADMYYQALIRLKDLFETEECFFGNQLMLLVKKPILKTA